MSVESPGYVWSGERVNITCNATVPQTGHPQQREPVGITWFNGTSQIHNDTG